MLIRALLALLLIVAVDWAPGIPPYPYLGMAQVRAQAPVPPDVWHPYRGGTNCVQVSDSQGRFNCAAGTTIDPATGNMVISGTLAFQGLAAGTFSNGLALAPVGTAVQLLGAGDLALSTSPDIIAPSGPLFQGATLRVRRGPAGTCVLVVAGGNSYANEFIIPVVPVTPQSGGFQADGNPANFHGYANLSTPPFPYATLLAFPGGPGGC